MKTGSTCRFEARVFRPAGLAAGEAPWWFLRLPQEASETLPRRGRVAVEGSVGGQPVQAILEPDGQLGHWLKLDEALLTAAGIRAGGCVDVVLSVMVPEPEPVLPEDFRQALERVPEALRVWQGTTTLARVDWVHWIESAKQAKTRAKRVESACDMLAKGKRRVCCFDPSGYYSKAFSAPQPEESAG